MKNSTNKYLNYLGGLLKGCNMFACIATSLFVIFTIYFLDGFNLLSLLLRKGAFVEAVVIITAVLGVLLIFTSTVKRIENKHIVFADNMLISGVFLFVFLLLYFIFSTSKAYLVLKIVLLACLFTAMVIIFLVRAKFFESVEKKVRTKGNATFYSYYENLLKKYWYFILILLVSIVAILLYLYTSGLVQSLVELNNTTRVLVMILVVMFSVLLPMSAERIREKEQGLIDTITSSLIFTSFTLVIIGFMSSGKIKYATLIMALTIFVIAIISTCVLINNTILDDNSAYKNKKGNFLLYFKDLFKNSHVILYFAIALLLTALMAMLEVTNFVHKIYEEQLGGQDPMVVVEAVCLVVALLFTLLLTEIKSHKIHLIDRVLFTLALAFTFILIVVNGVLGVEFIYEGLIAVVGLVISVAYIIIRTFFVKDFELNKDVIIKDKTENDVQSQAIELACEEQNNSQECACEEAIAQEQAVTQDEVVKLKRVSVKKSFEIYVRTGDSQLKENYSQLKNALLSYGLHSRLTKTRENFSKKGVTPSKEKEGKTIRLQAKLLVRGKFLKLYINVNPNSVDLKYFRAEDVSLKMPDQPLYVKIRSKLSLKRALELIDILAVQENFNAKKKFTEVDYASQLSSDGLTYMQKLGYDYMIKDSVTYEEVAVINDEWAEKIVKTELVKDPQRYIYDEVTLKDLEDNFDDGAIVSLEAMRQKGLIKVNANYVTIKASNTLSKKLIVEANVIEPKAIAMLYIAGGEATRLIGE